MAKEKSSSDLAEKKESIRGRNFTAIVYPDSENTPDNWEQIMRDWCLPCFISPLHDRDITSAGEPKKPHYHIVLMFEGKKSRKQVETLLSDIGAVISPRDDQFFVQSLRGVARYLCHLDDADKVQYSTDDVTILSGADYFEIIGLASDKYKAINEMKNFCDKYDIISFYMLDSYARKCRPDWAKVLADKSTLHIKEWLTSRKWSKENCVLQIADQNTGEIIFEL